MQTIEPTFQSHDRVPQAPAPARQPLPVAAPPQYHRMVLRLRRSQRAAGVLTTKVVFALDARADLSGHARSLVQKYGLGPLIVYDGQARKRCSETAADHVNSAANARGAGGSLAGLARGLASVAVAAMTLRITVASLTAGHHIECKDLNELIAAEDAIREACNNVRGYLEVAESFDGREEVVGF